jgi:hypothetical protein
MKAGRTLASAGALGLACLFGCSLINLDDLDDATDASAPVDDGLSFADGMGSAEASSADDAAMADGFAASDAVSASGADAASVCASMCDATQGSDVLDGAAPPSEASSSGSRSGSSGGSSSGSVSGSSGGSSSGSVSGSSGGSSSGSASGSASEAGSDAGDGHPCGADVLTPQMAVASSVQAGTIVVPASFAIDGNFATRWGSALQTDPSWIYMDFGKEVFVAEVDILWESACGANYDIDVSEDASTWMVVKSVVGNDVGAPGPPSGWNDPTALRYAGLSGRGRYVRINGTVRCDAMYGYSIWEMRALGDTDADCTVP